MRALFAFLAVNLGFIAANAFFAGAIYGVFKLGQLLFPDVMENPWFVLVFGTATLAGCLWCMKWSLEFIGAQRSKDRARARA